MPMGADPEKMAMAEAALQGDMMNDVEALIRQARASMENLETEHAYVFSRRALTLKPDHVEAIDIFALANTELGQLDEARDLWLQSVKLAPDQGYEKYLCLGQLSVEHEALDYYEQALERMRQHLTTLPLESDEAKMVASQMASALVSMTEIYLTDCW
jgi:tetratricopeptide (TPR) repeat protein